MNRIASRVNFRKGERFFIFYGFGIEDIFINQSGNETDIEKALAEALKANGFQRIAFIAPHKPLYFVDAESYSLFQPNAQSQQSEFDFMQELRGPLENRFLLKIARTDEPTNFMQMGDLHAIRLMDSLMRETDQVMTGVVFLQAETTLRYFEDQRTLAGLIGSWLRLPSDNPNICVMVFSAQNSDDISEVCKRIEIPEIRTMFARKKTKALYQILPIEGPDTDEILGLISTTGISTTQDDHEFNQLIRMIQAENQPARFWKNRFLEAESFSFTTAKEKGWFTSTIRQDVSALEQLNQLTGLEDVKKRILELQNWILYCQEKGIRSNERDYPLLHMIFSGNPGTGKTTVARLFGEILHDIGVLPRGHLIQVTASDLIADYVGGTAIKTNSVIDSAIGGVLFIDEAYAITEKDRGGFGKEAIDTLVARMDDEKGRLVIIAAGYPQKMLLFRKANPGLSRRFPEENFLIFRDYTFEELWEIFNKMMASRRLKCSEPVIPTIRRIIEEISVKRDEYFGNAGDIRNFVDSLERRHANRVIQNQLDINSPIETSDISELYLSYLPSTMPLVEDILFQLNQLVGLANVKEIIKKFIQLKQFELLMQKDHAAVRKMPHFLFYGNPGTGKTTLARLIGKIFQSLGLLRKGHLVEVSRADLVAGYVGQTALKTRDKLLEAVDGVLFIDEAYSLARSGSGEFGLEALDTIVKAMDDYADRMIMIAAGYQKEMEEFLASNPGLLSRFDTPILFPDYTPEELCEIFTIFAEKEGYIVEFNLKQHLSQVFIVEKNRTGRFFGNARFARQLFEQVKRNFASRILSISEPERSALINEKNRHLLTLVDLPIELYKPSAS